MPQPNVIHIDQALTDLSVAYTNAEYIAEQMMPSVQVKKRSNKWFVYGKEHLRYRSAKRAPGGMANEFDYTLSTALYYAENHAQRHLIPDDNEMQQDDPLDEEIDATMLLMESMMLLRENDTATFLTSTANMTNNAALAGTSRWDDYVNSTPLTSFKTAKSSVRNNSIKRANFIMSPYDVSLVLAEHPSIKELIKYTDPKALTESGLPPVIRGLRVIEAGAMLDAAVEGRAFSPSAVWGKNCIIGYVNPSPGLRTLSMAYTFVAPDATTGVSGYSTRTYREDARKGEWVETEITLDYRMIANGAGFLYATVIN